MTELAKISRVRRARHGVLGESMVGGGGVVYKQKLTVLLKYWLVRQVN